MLKAQCVYPSDLSDAEWARLAPLLPAPARCGRPRKWAERLVADAIFYVLRSGCAWRLLPREFPPWQTVYARFRRWRVSGALVRAHAALRASVRQAEGRESEPSAAVLDSQSAKTIGEDYWCRRARAWLRRREAAEGPQAPPAGGHHWPRVVGLCACGRSAGSRRRTSACGASRAGRLVAARARVGRPRVSWRVRALGAGDSRLDVAGRAPSRAACVALWPRTEASVSLSRTTAPVGSGAHVCLARTIPTAEQRLRAPARRE